MSICSFVGYDRPNVFLLYSLARIMPPICPFLLYLAACKSKQRHLGIPSWVYPSRSSPAWSFLRSHCASLSLAPSLAPTSVASKNLSSGVTAFSFASELASHLLSACACHATPSFPSSLTSFLRSLLHLRHLVYRCSTGWTGSLHHQHTARSVVVVILLFRIY